MLKYILKTILLSLAFSIILSALCVSGVTFAKTAIPISTKEEFYNIRNNLSGDYYLTCDIEFSDSDFSSSGEFYNSGKYFLPIGDGKNPFTGTLDGCGYTVSGIKVSTYGKVYSISVTPINTGIMTLADDGWTGDYIINTNPTVNVSPASGVFGVNNGTIENLNLSDCNISARSSNSATLYVGGLVGLNNGNIQNCSIKSKTLNCDKNSYIGGIVGYQLGGVIQNCFVYGKVESDGVFGSVVGAVADGKVINCYSDVVFTGNVGSLVGIAGIDVIENLQNCYYIASEDVNGYGKHITYIEAKNPKKYIGFDFENTWYMSGELRRPALKGVAISEGRDIKTGDLDENDEVTLLDLVSLAQHVAGWENEFPLTVANVNFDFTEDGEDIIDLQDVVYLAQWLANWDGVILY